MSKLLIIALLIGLLFALSGCEGTTPSTGSETSTPMALATATPASTPPPAAPSPNPTISVWLDQCTLLSSRDAASLFTTAEVEGPDHHVSEVNHTIFSTEPISATESSCINYVFNHPGRADQKLLQVTYWVDAPGQTTLADWDQIWTDARASAAQTVTGVGDDAFFNDGRLSFRKGIAYVTVEIISSGRDFNVPPGSAQQLDMEKQIALDILPNME